VGGSAYLKKEAQMHVIDMVAGKIKDRDGNTRLCAGMMLSAVGMKTVVGTGGRAAEE